MGNQYTDEVLTLRLTRREATLLASAVSGRHQEPEDENLLKQVRNYLGARVGWASHFTPDLNLRLERDRVGDGGDPAAVMGPLEYGISETARSFAQGLDPEETYLLARATIQDDCTRLGQDWAHVEPNAKVMFLQYFLKDRSPKG